MMIVSKEQAIRNTRNEKFKVPTRLFRRPPFVILQCFLSFKKCIFRSKFKHNR